MCFRKYANIRFCIVWRGCVCLCWPKITFDNNCSDVDAPATSLKQLIINKRRIFKGIICLFYRFLKSSKEEETFVVSYFWLIRSSACVQKQSRACTLVSECHPASMLLLSIAFGLFYIFMWCTVAGAKVIKSFFFKKCKHATQIWTTFIWKRHRQLLPRMHLIHIAPTTRGHDLAVRMKGGKRKTVLFRMSGGWLYNTVRSGMTDSQRSADKGNLCLFDATFAHTGRQVKSDMWKQKIKRTVSFHLCNAACVWRLCGEATFSFGVSHWHYKQRPLEKKPTYASIADASYGAHIAHLHIVATLLGAGLDCFLHSEVSCAGNIPQRF